MFAIGQRCSRESEGSSITDAAECTQRQGQGVKGSRCGLGWVRASSGGTELHVDVTRGAQGGVGCHGHDTIPDHSDHPNHYHTLHLYKYTKYKLL